MNAVFQASATALTRSDRMLTAIDRFARRGPASGSVAALGIWGAAIGTVSLIVVTPTIARATTRGAKQVAKAAKTTTLSGVARLRRAETKQDQTEIAVEATL